MTTTRFVIEPKIVQAIRAFLERVAVDFAVADARLYGSRARGDHDVQSDVDVAVFLEGARADTSDLLRTKLAMADIAFDLLLETGILVSPLPIWEEDWRHPDRYSNPRLLQNILREGVIL